LRGGGVLKFFLILGSVFALDLITKIVIRSKMAWGEEIAVLPFFSIVHVTNTGIAFGMFQNKNFLFALIGIAVSIGMVLYALRLRKEDPVSALLLAGILGGALGNLYDRLVYGRVTDFLDFYIGRQHWPAFNVADSAICVGAGLLLVLSLKRRT
jgi:signal peptidase II